MCRVCEASDLELEKKTVRVLNLLCDGLEERDSLTSKGERVCVSVVQRLNIEYTDPSMRRWSYVSARNIIGRGTTSPFTTIGRSLVACIPKMALSKT